MQVLQTLKKNVIDPAPILFGLLVLVLLGNIIGVFSVGVHHDEAYY